LWNIRTSRASIVSSFSICGTGVWVGDAQFIAQFEVRHAGKAGTFGTVRTANWLREPTYDAPAGGLIRLRIAATDVTRIYRLNIEGAEATVIAMDGNPVPAFRPSPDAILIGPGPAARPGHPQAPRFET
jgi:FtsP/CotA-like multicopper oxidase with cupredoxin domain